MDSPQAEPVIEPEKHEPEPAQIDPEQSEPAVKDPEIQLPEDDPGTGEPPINELEPDTEKSGEPDAPTPLTEGTPSPDEPVAEPAPEEISAEDLLPEEPEVEAVAMGDAQLKAVLEAIIYVTDEPLTIEQICIAIEQPEDRVIEVLEILSAEYEKADRGLMIREVAGGFRIGTRLHIATDVEVVAVGLKLLHRHGRNRPLHTHFRRAGENKMGPSLQRSVS